MTLTAGKFIRLFLLHVLPSTFHYIRHCGLTTNSTCKANLTQRCELLVQDKTQAPTDAETNGADAADGDDLIESATYVCPYCGAILILIGTFRDGQMPCGACKRSMRHSLV